MTYITLFKGEMIIITITCTWINYTCTLFTYKSTWQDTRGGREILTWADVHGMEIRFWPGMFIYGKVHVAGCQRWTRDSGLGWGAWHGDKISRYLLQLPLAPFSLLPSSASSVALSDSNGVVWPRYSRPFSCLLQKPRKNEKTKKK